MRRKLVLLFGIVEGELLRNGLGRFSVQLVRVFPFVVGGLQLVR